MALVNLVKVSTATTGTGTVTLGAASTGFLTMAQAGAVDGAIYSYGITDGVNSEVGTGTYTASGTTLSRTVINSTNSNALLSLSGAATVFITPLAVDYGANVITKTAGYTETANSGHRIVLCDLVAGFTVVMPTAVGNTGKYTFKKMQAAGSIIIDGSGSETIDGGLTATLTDQYQAITLVSNNANWMII